MKTTLELPADLLRRIKALAAMQGRSMKVLITEALEATLENRPERAISGWRSVFGRATPAAVRDVDRRLDELERVNPKDWE